MDGWVSYNTKDNYKIIVAPFDKKDKNLLEEYRDLRFIVDADSKKVYVSSGHILHETMTKKIGLDYLDQSLPIMFGLGFYKPGQEKIVVIKTGLHYVPVYYRKKFIGEHFDFAYPYFTNLKEKIEFTSNDTNERY